MGQTAELPPRTTRQVRDDRVRAVAGFAAKAFEGFRAACLWHGLPAGGGLIEARAWRCGRPGDGAHAFTLMSVPGQLVVVVGDLGTCVWKRARDMLRWATSAISDVDYFAGKVIREIPTKEYDPDVVRAWAHGLDRDILDGECEYDSRRAKLWLGEGVRQQVLDAVDDGGHEVRRVIHESGLADGCDFPDFDNWTHGFLWCREAVRWFLDNHGGA